MGAIFAEAAQQWQAVKADYDAELEVSYLAAEAATNGYLLTRRATLAGVSAWSLFKGPAGAAYLNASDELIEWWEHGTPRMNLAAFERQWLRDQQDRPDCLDCHERAEHERRQDEIAESVKAIHQRHPSHDQAARDDMEHDQ